MVEKEAHQAQGEGGIQGSVEPSWAGGLGDEESPITT